MYLGQCLELTNSDELFANPVHPYTQALLSAIPEPDISMRSKEIKVIKTVRELTGLGLKEAKDLVDNAPKPIKEGLPKEECEKIVAMFKEVGATIEVK